VTGRAKLTKDNIKRTIPARKLRMALALRADVALPGVVKAFVDQVRDRAVGPGRSAGQPVAGPGGSFKIHQGRSWEAVMRGRWPEPAVTPLAVILMAAYERRGKTTFGRQAGQARCVERAEEEVRWSVPTVIVRGHQSSWKPCQEVDVHLSSRSDAGQKRVS